ncbi:MAG: hypothetical protein ACRD24_08975 [Terriglobales bacterium]
MEPIRTIRMREERSPDDVRLLDALINDEGDLVFDGYDLGKSVEEFWGDRDYEWWLYVRQPHKERVLNELKAERFPDPAEYPKWLALKEIPDDPDSVLLWLITVRFKGDVDFREWLEAKGIASEFSSWV